MKTFFALAVIIFCVAIGYSESRKIIPVDRWPRVINMPDRQVINPSPEICVSLGYRLITQKDAVPKGKRVISEIIIQDPEDPKGARIVRTFEDLPQEMLVSVSPARVVFQFTTSGVFSSAVWLDAPATNKVEK